MRSFANGEIALIPVSNDLKTKAILEDSFTLNKATSMTFALLLAHKKPRSLLDGSVIDTRRALSKTNRLEYHHIFPKAHLERVGVSKIKANMHLNICMLNLTNNREISDKDPSDYFSTIEERLGNHLSEVLISNYINNEAFLAAKSGDYEKFLSERDKEILKEIKKLTYSRIS